MRASPDYIYRVTLVSLCLLIVGLTTGCTVITKEVGTPIPADQADLIEGQARIGDVIGALGPPDNLTALGGVAAFIYEYVDIKENQVGLNFEGDVFKWFKFSLASSTGKREALVLIFDEDGLLTGRRFYRWEENLGKGAGIAFIVGAKSLVDTSHLEQEPGAFAWGSTLLKPLPEGLNRGQSMDSGLGGLEQRGTTDKVGQRTLEMK